jgi:predicted nucleic acid-binding protein
VIQYLVDSTALWRILCDSSLRQSWTEVVTAGAVGSCNPQRVEFRRSARDAAEYDQMSAMFADLYPDAAVPKDAWQWVESAQHRLLHRGAHRALSAVDLLICSTAAVRGLVVLHDDGDFVTAAKILPDVRERSVWNVPPAG